MHFIQEGSILSVAFGAPHCALLGVKCCSVWNHPIQYCSGLWNAMVNNILTKILKSDAYNTAFYDGNNLFERLRISYFQRASSQRVVSTHFSDSPILTPTRNALNFLHVIRFAAPQARTRYDSHLRCYYVPFVFNNLAEGICDNTSTHSRKTVLIFLTLLD